MTWKVEVIEYYTGNIVKTLEAKSERAADRIDDGININLDHDAFFTRVVDCEIEEGV